MKCEKCQQREATIHLTQTRQGQTSEHHLCEPCARELGIGHNITDYFGTIGNLFGSGLIDSGSVFHTTGGIPAFGAAAGRNITCPVCIARPMMISAIRAFLAAAIAMKRLPTGSIRFSAGCRAASAISAGKSAPRPASRKNRFYRRNCRI